MSGDSLEQMSLDGHVIGQECAQESDEDYKRAEAIALSASHILSSQKTRSKSPLLISRKHHHRPTPPVEILTDPEQRRLVEQSIHSQDLSSEMSIGGISLMDTTNAAKKELQRLSVTVNKTVEKFMDIIHIPAAATTATSFDNPVGIVKEPVSMEQSLHVEAEMTDGILNVETPTLTSIVYKRRSGLGILSSKAWERRKLVLVGNKLLYFKLTNNNVEESKGKTDDEIQLEPTSEELNSSVSMVSEEMAASSSSSNSTQVKKTKDLRQLWEQATQMTQNLLQQAEPAFSKSNDPTVPRGCIDLWKDQAMVAISFATPNTGNNATTATISENTTSPSSSLLVSTAHVAPTPYCLTILVKSESKWKLCFDTQEEQRLWLLTLSDIIVKGSVKYYNDGLTAIGGPIDGFHPPPNDKDSVSKVDESTTTFNHEPSSLPLVGAEPNTTSTMEDPIQNKESRDSSNSSWYRHDRILVPMTNFVLLFIYITPLRWIYFLALLCAVNSFIFPQSFMQIMTLWKKGSKESVSEADTTSHHHQQLLEVDSIQVTASKDIDWTYKPQAGSTMNRAQSASDRTETSPCSWCSLPPKHIQVRSFGYTTTKTKTKIPAPYALYEPVYMDIFKSTKRIGEVASKVTLPPQNSSDGNVCPWKSPDWFVVSLAIPKEAPKLSRPTIDGDGFMATIYYSIKPETKEILKRITSDSYNPIGPEEDVDIQSRRYNGVRLFEEWCNKAPTDSQWQGRFKFIPNVDNLNEVGLPSWISTWCGKPTLIKRKGITGFLHSLDTDQNRIMEFDISFHPFPYLAKSAVAFLVKDRWCKKFLLNCSFVIEGRCDDELPEVLIGDPVQVYNVDPELFVDAEDVFSVKRS